MTEGSFGISIGTTIAQARISILVAVLKMIRDFLQSALAALPLSARERNPQDDSDAKPDDTSEIRRIGERVLADFIDPAIRELTRATAYGTEEAPSS